MNIFQKLGNKIEQEKKRKQKEIERYWKLPPQERMHYDSIIKEFDGNRIYLGMFTYLITKLIIIAILFTLGLQYYFLHTIYFNNTIEILRSISVIIILTIVTDMCLCVVSDMMYPIKIKKLNKRFKL